MFPSNVLSKYWSPTVGCSLGLDSRDTLFRLLRIHHIDLYRLSGHPDDFSPLNLEYVYRDCISLIEWPVRLPPSLQPPDKRRLEVDIRIQPADENEAEIDNNPRIVTLSYPKGSEWQQHIRKIVEEGYLDDMIVE